MLRSSAARSVVASLAAALTLLAASCGGGDDPEPPEDPPESLLRQAAANPPRSGEAAIGVDLALEGDSLLAGSVRLSTWTGPSPWTPMGGCPSFDFGMDAELAGFGVDGSLVSTGEDAFVVFFGENYRVGPERTAELRERGCDGARRKRGWADVRRMDQRRPLRGRGGGRRGRGGPDRRGGRLVRLRFET